MESMVKIQNTENNQKDVEFFPTPMKASRVQKRTGWTESHH